MFTGIIEDIGVVKLKDIDGIFILTKLNDIKLGESIAVNGVCLTAKEVKRQNEGLLVRFDVSSETLQRTNLKFLKPADKVNLERSLKITSRLSGHLVLGHIDTTTKLIEVEKELYFFEIPKGFEKYIVEKGSVALDGISLTVAKKFKDKFCVAVIPFTLKNTNLKYKKIGDLFNLEVDILARYVESILLNKRGIDLEFLKKHGFIK